MALRNLVLTSIGGKYWYFLFSSTCLVCKFKAKDTNTKGKQLFTVHVWQGKQNAESNKTESENILLPLKLH